MNEIINEYQFFLYVCPIVVCYILAYTWHQQDCCVDNNFIHDVLAVVLVHFHQTRVGPRCNVSRNYYPCDGGERKRLGAVRSLGSQEADPSNWDANRVPKIIILYINFSDIKYFNRILLKVCQ